MDSPQEAKNTSPAQEFSYLNYVNNSSPIETVETTHPSQVILGLNSSPCVFQSPCVSSQCLEISPTDNGVISLDDDDFQTFGCQTQNDFHIQNDAPLSVDDYLVDHNWEVPGNLEADFQEGPHSDAQDGERHDGMSRHCLQFEEAASKDLEPSSPSLVAAAAVVQNLTPTKTEVPKLFLHTPQPSICSSSSHIGCHSKCLMNSMPEAATATATATTNMGLPNTGFHFELVDVDTNTITSFDPTSVQDKRKLTYENARNSEEFNHPRITERKRQKRSSNTGGDGCKQCNCKKSKCLKLYCECFTAGSYCDDKCACQGCYNIPEYEEVITEIKQQIGSRNPLAFAPKIEDVNLSTTSSARHRRGCNCKKSNCSKRYCECYQANVGCSGACRCEGCKNPYGKRKDYATVEHGLSQQRLSTRVEKGSNNKVYNNMEMVTNQRDSFRGEFHDLHSLTPSLQIYEHNTSQHNSFFGRYQEFPEVSDITMFQSEQIISETGVIPEKNEMLGSGTYDQRLDYNNVEIMNEASVLHNLVPSLHQRTLSERYQESPEVSGITMFQSEQIISETDVIPKKNETLGSGTYGQQLDYNNVEIMNEASVLHNLVPSLHQRTLSYPRSILSHANNHLLSGSPMTRFDETRYPHHFGLDRGVNYDILEDQMLNEKALNVMQSEESASPYQRQVCHLNILDLLEFGTNSSSH